MKMFLTYFAFFLLTGTALAQDSTRVDIFPSTVKPKSLITETVTAEYDDQYVYVHILNFTGTAIIEIKNAVGAPVSRIKAGITNAASVYIPIDHLPWWIYYIHYNCLQALWDIPVMRTGSQVKKKQIIYKQITNL